jgi:hypothetical protein
VSRPTTALGAVRKEECEAMSGVAILATVLSVATALFVLGLFVWAARKDGEEDRATQRRLGIRRRTRL